MLIMMMTNVGYFVVMVNSHIIYFISLLHSTLHTTHDHFGRGDEFASYRETNHVSPNILNHDPYKFISTSILLIKEQTLSSLSAPHKTYTDTLPPHD